MNLLSTVALVRNLILENVGEDGLVTDDQLKDLIKIANRTIWKMIVERNPRAFEEVSGDLVAPAAGLAYGAISAGSIYKIEHVEAKAGQEYRTIWPLSDAGDRHVNEGLVESHAVSLSWLPRWYLQGQVVKWSPQPAGAFVARVSYLPGLADPGDASELLGGLYGMHHDVVAIRAAMLAYSKDEVAETPYDDDYKEVRDLLLRDVAQEQGQDSRRVGSRDPW